MKKLFIILILAVMLVGCSLEVIYDEPLVIIGKELIDNEDYRYKYLVQLKYRNDFKTMKPKYRMHFFSNKNFSVSEIIWIGNARGETLRDNQ